MLKIYNTLTKKVENFRPRKDKFVQLFVCGPTVYDYPHLGHARVYIFFDFFAKFLKYLGYKVYFLMNITDVDDKIIQKAQEENKKPFEIAKKYEKIFFQNLKDLKITSINKTAPASKYISKILAQIENLLKKGYAYITSDGSVYFQTRKFKDYGKLSGQNIEDLKNFEEARNKKDPLDFALWKGRINDNEPVWKTPWGKGRPGWHIEDTAITETFFGVQYDVHGGGLDLIFPHHECEIAQQEAASGKKPFVKYWIHVNLLMINGEKMSKSLGNFITINDFLKTYSGRFVRFLLLKYHYQNPIDLTEKIIKEAEQEFFLLNEKMSKLLKAKRGKVRFSINELKQKILNPLLNNLNTYVSISNLYFYLNELEKIINEDGLLNKKEIVDFLKSIDNFYNFIFPWKTLSLQDKKLIMLREKYRENKNYEKSDKIRQKLFKKRIILEDLVDGTLVVNLN